MHIIITLSAGIEMEVLILGREVRYTQKRGTRPTEEQIAMIEAARNLSDEYDEDTPEIDPNVTPEHYAALMQAVAERNQRVLRWKA